MIGSMVNGSMVHFTYLEMGYSYPLILTIDPNFLGHPNYSHEKLTFCNLKMGVDGRGCFFVKVGDFWVNHANFQECT